VSAPRVAVIMRSKDSAWVIDRALAALYSQTVRDLDVLVVDSGSRDGTLDIVRRYPCRLVQIPAKSYIPGVVLNDAIASTSAPVIVFQNSDVVPLVDDALQRLIAPLERGAAATFARQVPRPEAHTWVRRDYACAFPAEGAAPSFMPYSLPFASMRRDVWERRPFYREAWGSEDTEWGLWARSAGLTVEYVPDAIVMHSHNYTLRQLYGRRFIEGEADAFLYGEKPSLARSGARILRSIASDVKAHIRAGDYAGLVASLPRRSVYHAAHFRGLSHGDGRRRTGNTDVTVGQEAVLSRY
jgi:rhamnosyltransferase